MKPNTIRIFRTPTTSGRDFKNINTADFDPKIHKKYVEPEVPEEGDSEEDDSEAKPVRRRKK